MQDERSPEIQREELETALGPQRTHEFDELNGRAQRTGARLRLRRQSPTAWGRERFVFIVDLDPRGPHRSDYLEEPSVAHGRLEDAAQHVAELERRYGGAEAS